MNFLINYYLCSTIGINAKGSFNVSQVIVPKMKPGGSIVNVSSLASLASAQDHCIYSMSKSAMDAMTKYLAMELGPKNIRVNSVNPTVVLTRMGLQVWGDPEKAAPLKNKIPLGR